MGIVKLQRFAELVSCAVTGGLERRLYLGRGGEDELLRTVAEDDVERPSDALMECIETIALDKFPQMERTMHGSSLIASAVVLEEFVAHYLQPLTTRRLAPAERITKKRMTFAQQLAEQRLRRKRPYRPVLNPVEALRRLARLRERAEARDDFFTRLMRRGPSMAPQLEDDSWIKKSAAKERAMRQLNRATTWRHEEAARIRAVAGLPPRGPSSK